MGEFLRRRDDDAGERSRSRLRHPADEADAKVPQHVAGVALAPKRAKALRGLREFAANDRLEQFVLGVEIGVERALGDACGARNVVHARAVEAGAQEHLAGAVHDLAPFGAAVIDRARCPAPAPPIPYQLHPLDHESLLTEPFGSIFVAIRARLRYVNEK